MTAAEVTQVHPDAPQGASALVVAIEKYDGYNGEDIPRSAQLAARFVIWLVECGVCPPERVTFMVSYDEAKYLNGTYDPSWSPKPLINRLETEQAFRGVKILTQAKAINVLDGAKTDGDFRNWISDWPYRPERDDTRFVLFWIGHGHAIKNDIEQRVFLPCSDASGDDPYNVELVQLVSAVSAYAPRAHVAGFVQACRYPVQREAEATFEARTEPVARRGEQIPARDLSRRVAILCAADHGERTQMAGRDDSIFADVVLEWLEDPGRNAAEAISETNLITLVQELESRGFWPDLRGYGALRYVTQPPAGDVVSEQQWLELLNLAKEIDDSSRPTAARVRWGAYCQAVGPSRVLHGSDQLLTLQALFKIIRHFEPRTVGGAPPLVVACDFVAELADPKLPKLIDWCKTWAARGHDESQLLVQIRDARPLWLDDRPYVSIALERIILDPDARPIPNLGHPVYSLDPVFFGVSCPERLDQPWFDGTHILEAFKGVISQALERQGATLDDLIVEIVLPGGLLGWWVEYINEEDGEPALGVTHPIVIRDAERAKKKNVAPPRRGEIAWRTCDEVEYKNLGMIGVDARSATYLVLDRDSVGETGAQLRQKMPDVPKQIRVAIEHGTPNVISIQPGSRCGSCGSGQPSEADGCSMLKLRKFLTDEWPGRADELPIKLRRMREQIFRKNLPPETKISVLTQEPTRIWAGYYYSQLVSGFLPTSSSLRSGRV